MGKLANALYEREKMNEIRLATLADIQWLAAVAKRETEALGFLPNVQIKQAIELGFLKVHEESRSFVLFRLRKDGVTTVGTICVPLFSRGKGIGRMLIGSLPKPIQLKCPAFLPSNEFYKALGFKFVKFEQNSKRPVNVWRLEDE